MAKEVIFYNLAPHVTDEQYKEYVVNEKGPLLESFESVNKFTLVKISHSVKGEIPYKYVGILDINNLADFTQNVIPSEKFQGFLAKWSTMVQPDFHSLIGEEVF
jgi:hypothetical protein